MTEPGVSRLRQTLRRTAMHRSGREVGHVCVRPLRHCGASAVWSLIAGRALTSDNLGQPHCSQLGKLKPRDAVKYQKVFTLVFVAVPVHNVLSSSPEGPLHSLVCLGKSGRFPGPLMSRGNTFADTHFLAVI